MNFNLDLVYSSCKETIWLPDLLLLKTNFTGGKNGKEAGTGLR